MKKIANAIIAFIVMSTTIFVQTAPIAAINLSEVKSEQEMSITTSNVEISDRYHIIENGYLDKYDLQEGVFGHQSSQQVNKTAVYFYSDGYFANAPEIYNPSLSTMSLALAISAFNAIQDDFDFTLPNGSYSNLFRHAKVLFSDLGIKDNDIYINESLDVRPTTDSIGMIMGAKEITLDNGNYILLPIAVRGGDYESEWSSNVTLGTSGEAYGFSSSATKVVEQIENYINSNTSFDISAALNEGRVKFWVVGYSRGGAVANITAKRLTDNYAKNGNYIYSYSFEAPMGGVDSEEINESWTYNGIYANLHNVINTGDLVPQIPPKQLGFKRYGVDHYMPGTDAGEIYTSIYTTPTGITVTTYADNVAYVVGDNDYNARRPEMLNHLSNIDSNIDFIDEFSLATIDLAGAIFKGNYAFKTFEGENNLTAAEWIQCFIHDLLEWAANGTYDYGQLNNGGYNGDYRDFYTSNTQFAGQEYVSLEVALQHILKSVFMLRYYEDIGTAIFYRLLSSLDEYATIFDFYMNAIQKWDKISESKQNAYLDKIWECMDGDLNYLNGTPVPKITDFVAPEDREAFKQSFYTLSAFLFLFVSKDHTTNPSINGIDKTQIHLITLFYNLQTILQGHYPEICFAWLRTYDKNYSSDNKNAKYTNTEVKLINDNDTVSPDVETIINVEDAKTTVSLYSIIKSNSGVDKQSTNNGSAIYYAIFKDSTIVGNWQLYREPIVIDTSDDSVYSIKAFAVRFEEKGTELEITNEQIRTSPVISAPIEDAVNDAPIEAPKESKAKQPIQIIIILISSVILLILGTLLIIKKLRSKNAH